MKNCDTLPLYLVVHVFSDLFSPRLRFASFVRVVFLGRAVLYARDYYSVSSASFLRDTKPIKLPTLVLQHRSDSL